MAEVIGYMISDAMAGGAGFEPALPEGRPNYQSGAINHSATPAASAEMVPAFRNCNPLRQTHLWEALKPFVEAFEKRRDAYSKRYQDRELGFSNFDKMPDDWAMEAIPFDMGTYRRARAALASEGSTDA